MPTEETPEQKAAREKAVADAAEAQRKADEAAAALAATNTETVSKKDFDAIYKKAKETERQLEAAAAKLKEIERAQLTETERLRAELAEAKPAAEQGKKAREAVERLVEDEIKLLPENLRALVPSAEKYDPIERLDWIRAARASVPAETPVPGTSTSRSTSSGKRWTASEFAALDPREYPKHAAEIQATLAANGGRLPDR